jgi:hypothetical protein
MVALASTCWNEGSCWRHDHQKLPRANLGSWQLLMIGVAALPYWVGEPAFSLVAEPGIGSAGNLER